MIRRSKGLILLILALLLIVGCTPGTAEQPKGSEGASSTPSQSSSQVRDDLVIGIEASPTTMLANTDVNFVNDLHIKSIYEPLFNRNEKGELEPYLATEWKNIDDLTWQIKLREGVKFHNGEPFNAEAVKFTIDYVQNPDNKSGYFSYFSLVEKIEIIDDYEFLIITSAPFANIINRFSDNLIIMPPQYIKEVGLEKAAVHPVGTGPYKFVEWEKDQYVKLEANPDYWQGEPSIKKVTFKVYPEFSTRLSAFMSGEIDLFNNVPVDSVSVIENGVNAKIASVSTARVFYLVLNNNYDGPLKDQKVRQAINYAIDVDELLESVLNGFGTKMIGPLSRVNSGFTETFDYGYDPDKAIALLKEAGYEPQDLDLQIDTTSGRFPMDSQVAQAIASQLQRIGVKLTVQVNEYNAHQDKARNKKMKDMYLSSLGTQFEPSSTFDGLFLSTSQNATYTTPELDEMVKAAKPIIEPEARKKAYDELQHKVVEEAGWVPLWQQADVYAVNKNLDFVPRVDQRYMIQDMKWSQ